METFFSDEGTEKVCYLHGKDTSGCLDGWKDPATAFVIDNAAVKPATSLFPKFDIPLA